MIEEIGEVVALLKKRGETAVIEDPVIRAHFLEEMSDVLMYYGHAGVPATSRQRSSPKPYLKNTTETWAEILSKNTAVICNSATRGWRS